MTEPYANAMDFIYKYVLQIPDLVSLTVFPKAHLPHVPKAHGSKTHKIGGAVWGHSILSCIL